MHYFGLGDTPPAASPLPAPAGKTPRGFDYAYQVTLTANQYLPDQALAINSDAEFLLMALCGTQTGPYAIRLRDAEGFLMSSALLRNANVIGTRENPRPMLPELRVPPGGKLGIDIQNLTGADNVIEIVFIGVKQF